MFCHDRSCAKALTSCYFFVFFKSCAKAPTSGFFFCFLYVNSVQGGYYNMGFNNEAWFATHRGLLNVGVDVKNLNNGDVFVEDINFYFGPGQGTNYWKYNERPPLEEKDKILLLYKPRHLRSTTTN
jgi:hypothetical protein